MVFTHTAWTLQKKKMRTDATLELRRRLTRFIKSPKGHSFVAVVAQMVRVQAIVGADCEQDVSQSNARPDSEIYYELAKDELRALEHDKMLDEIKGKKHG